MKLRLFFIGLVAVAPALAQHHPGHDSQSRAQVAPSGYAGLRDRAIKSLSEEEIADLRAGKGMRLALPAELNGYPGPAHALELAGALGLSDVQKEETLALAGQMRAEARQRGEDLIAREHELDRVFRNRTATDATVHEAAAKAARAQGELRAAHLRYHLLMLDVLTPVQVAQYAKLRGYD